MVVMRQWKKTATGGSCLYLGDQAVAYVAQGEKDWSAWAMLTRGNEAVFSAQDWPAEAEAKGYAERQVELWLLRAELREV